MLRAGQTVPVHGTGGVALFGLQFARLHGAPAIVVSGDADKRERALALGASHAIAREQGGRVAVIGVLEGSLLSGSAYQVIRSRGTVQGISVGHRRALEEMVRAIDVNALQPVIAAEYGADEVPAAFAHLARGAFGKVVVRF